MASSATENCQRASAVPKAATPKTAALWRCQANESILGPNATPKAAVLTALATIALAADLPELCVLGGLFVYAMAPGKKIAMPEWCGSFAHINMSERLGSHVSVRLLGACLVAALASLLTQFAVALISALVYLVLYEHGRRSLSSAPKVHQGQGNKPTAPAFAAPVWKRRQQAAGAKPKAIPRHRSALPGIVSMMAKGPGSSDKSPTATAPVDCAVAPRTALDAEVQELVRSSSATKADEVVARQLMKLARKCILPVVPEAQITVTPSGNLALIGETGSKPEVEMIITVDPVALADRLKAYFLRGKTRIQKSLDTLHPDVLQKTATKCLSERLTFVRFWRSQFTGPEPMIVLLVPVEQGIFKHSIRVNFSVNTPYPLRLATVMSKECVRSKELILLVVRWARERCIANTSKGQLHAYAWSLLVIYFLRSRSAIEEVEKTTAELFRDFVLFYDSWFQRRDEPMSICFSKTQLPPSGEGTLWGVPYVEDPFDAEKPAGASMTVDGLTRVKEEFARARALLEADGEAKLAKLAARWTPPEQPSQNVA